MLTTIAEIVTPTSRVEVLEGSWPKPIEQTWIDPRPVVTLLFRSPDYTIEGCYRPDRARPALDPMGKVFFAPPDIEFFARGTGGAVKAARCIFDPEFYARTIGSDGSLTQSQLRRCLDVQGALLPSMLLRLMDESVSPGFASGAFTEFLAGAILIEWAKQVLHRDEAPALPAGLTARQTRLIEELIASCDIGVPSISALAAACGLGERQFCRVFRAAMGESVGRYLTRVQIARAQRLLADSDMPLKEIAFRAGFAHASNFSAAFRAAVNQPPGEFRRLHRRRFAVSLP
jgi:AraC family transcriptional regulator